MIFEILGLFFNALIAQDKYSIPNRKDLPQLIQIQLSKKQKLFFWIFSCISEI